MDATNIRTERGPDFIGDWMTAWYQALTGRDDCFIHPGNKLRFALSDGCNWDSAAYGGERGDGRALVELIIQWARRLFNIA